MEGAALQPAGEHADQAAQRRQGRQEQERTEHPPGWLMEMVGGLVIHPRLTVERHVEQPRHVEGRAECRRRAERPQDVVAMREGMALRPVGDRKSTRLNSSHVAISYAVFCLKKKKKETGR